MKGESLNSGSGVTLCVGFPFIMVTKYNITDPTTNLTDESYLRCDNYTYILLCLTTRDEFTK